MAHAKASYPSITRGILCREISCGYRVCKHGETNLTDFRLTRWNNSTIVHNVRKREKRNPERERELMVQCSTSSPPSSTEEVELDGKIEDLDAKNGDGEGQFGDLVREYGWKVRRMVEEQSEMRKVAQVQAEAFHEPVFLFNDLFFQFFQVNFLLFFLLFSCSCSWVSLFLSCSSCLWVPNQKVYCPIIKIKKTSHDANCMVQIDLSMFR